MEKALINTMDRVFTTVRWRTTTILPSTFLIALQYFFVGEYFGKRKDKKTSSLKFQVISLYIQFLTWNKKQNYEYTPPTYFPSISHFVAMSQADGILFEIEDNFQNKRTAIAPYIYSPYGIQLLNIPVKHSKTITKRYSSRYWFRLAETTLQVTRDSIEDLLFFEFFEDDIRPFFEKKHKFYWT
jgi:hypothetical protein